MTMQFSSRQFVFKALLTSGFLLAVVLCLSLFAEQASAHGYVEAPASRALLCKQGVNKDCGAIIYEPQSLEAPKGFPAAGPADGKIASAGGAFPKLDEQSSTRWSKVPITSGTTTFNWRFTAKHASTSYRYFITKQNWDPNAPLSRSQFDLTPFCTVNANGARPPDTLSHTCQVPSRTGYQVILAVWDIADTGNAFYNAIDVQFASGPQDTTPPTVPGNLTVSDIGTTSAKLAWLASTDNVQVSNYKIYSGSTVLATVPASQLSHTLTGLTSSTSYTLYVKAVDSSNNESSASNSVSFTTGDIPIDLVPPTAPPGLHVMGTPTSISVELMWSPSTDNVGVTGYRIYNGSTFVTEVSSTTLSYTVTGLSPETTYLFNVTAVDAANNESASSSVSATTAAPPVATPWAPNVSYAQGTEVTYNGVLYVCRQAHTSLNGWEPPNVLALWLPV